MNNDNLTAADGVAESELHSAAWHGDVNEVRLLVEAGADVNWNDSIGETALFGAAASDNIEVVKYLLTVGAKHDLHELHSGYTPLHWAARSSIEVLKALVEAGADTEAKDGFDKLPIDVAHQYGNGKNVAYLKKFGPEIESRR